MTVKVLIVDPDISFTVPIKRALEISGDYKVNVFASAQPALELLQRDSHDVAILDPNVDDMTLPEIVEKMRRIQPWLFILISPRSPEASAQLSGLDIQGTIAKPYFARQLGPVIREAALTRARMGHRPSGRTQELSQIPDLEERLEEPLIQPDDTFRRVVDIMRDGDTSQSIRAASADVELPVNIDATVRELVSGRMSSQPPAQTEDEAATEALPSPPDSVPETIPPEPEATGLTALAEMALEVADDDTVPIESLSDALSERAEMLPPESRPDFGVLPPWTPSYDPDEPTLIEEPAFKADDTVPTPSGERPLPPMLDEPGFVAEMFDEQPSAAFSPAGDTAPLPRPPLDLDALFADEPGSDQDDGAEFEEEDAGELAFDEDFARTFAPLLPLEEQEQPADAALVIDEEMIQRKALALLGVENLDGPTDGGADDEAEPEAEPEEEAAEMAAPAEPPSGPPPVVEMAAQLPADPVVQMALQLTQLTMESAAQVSVLSRGRELIAKAGLLQERDLIGLMEEVGQVWEGSQPAAEPGQMPARFRYIQLPSGSDFLMYSTRTVDDMTMTTLFPGDVPLKTIRRQTRQLLQALVNVPEPEPEAARTKPSRPTDLYPPPGLREAAETPSEAAEVAEEVTSEATVETGEVTGAERPEGPYASYAFVWLPRGEDLSSELASLLIGWLHEIAVAHHWQIDGVEIQPSYVVVQIGIPSGETPAATVEALKEGTALRAGNAALWAEGYYVVAPGRAVTQQEIASFIAYQQGVA